MSSVDELIAQHVRESEAHLRHIDELMARADRESQRGPHATKLKSLLGEIKANRARLALSLQALRSGFASGGSPELLQHGEGLRSDLQAIGSEFEKALTAVLDTRGV